MCSLWGARDCNAGERGFVSKHCDLCREEVKREQARDRMQKMRALRK
jgi:hypothetical protein